LQDKYDHLKRKHKGLKKQIKKKDKECLDLKSQLELAKSNSSSPSKLQVLATMVVSATGL